MYPDSNIITLINNFTLKKYNAHEYVCVEGWAGGERERENKNK